jgi:ubiquinol-cytochrome c reductase cytochrome c1 subunit
MQIINFRKQGLIIAGLSVFMFLGIISKASEDYYPPKQMNWPFKGIFGMVDRQAAQRGFQVYSEVCSTCHGMSHLYYRNLEDIGFTKKEIKEIAAQYELEDGPNDMGEMYTRPATPNDNFVSPFPNEAAARVANGGAYPVDLSLIIKAREDGANYVYSLLTGYREPPEGFDMMEGLYYNPFFPGRQIAMPPPLSHNLVEYKDGTPASIEQMSRDLVIFLQWAAEPEMEHRKSMGLKVMIYLIIFTSLFYMVNKKIWKKVKS